MSEKHAKAMEEFPDVPEEEVSVAELYRQIDEVHNHNREIELNELKKSELETYVSLCERNISDDRNQIEELNRKIVSACYQQQAGLTREEARRRKTQKNSSIRDLV